jgi:hypothetical protein
MMTLLYSHVEWEFGMEQISKSDFKAHALEVLRDIEKSAQSRMITDQWARGF